MTASDQDFKPEFSRPIPVDRLRRGPTTERIEADAAERAALADRFELEAIDSLTAELRLETTRDGMVRVVGRLEAAVTQTCVVSLEPVPAAVSESFSALFAPPEMIDENDDEIDLESLLSDEDDPPEAIVNNRIDIGELTAQHLSLALDPYPRAPGLEFDDVREHDDPQDGYDALAEDEPDPAAQNDGAQNGGAQNGGAQDDGKEKGPTRRPFADLDKLLKKN